MKAFFYPCHQSGKYQRTLWGYLTVALLMGQTNEIFPSFRSGAGIFKIFKLDENCEFLLKKPKDCERD